MNHSSACTIGHKQGNDCGGEKHTNIKLNTK